ncbi:MAG: hypothetical protein ACUVWP_01775 [bacterium]
MKERISNIDRLFLVLDYIGPLSLLSAGRRHIKFMRYHFEQGLSFFFVELFIFMIIDILLSIFGIVNHLIYSIMIFVILFPVNIIAIIRSLQNVYFKIPIIGWERKRLEKYLGI